MNSKYCKTQQKFILTQQELCLSALSRNFRVAKLEAELAQARQDVANLDTQLIGSINQKLQLSQQLEMWQVRVKIFVTMSW